MKPTVTWLVLVVAFLVGGVAESAPQPSAQTAVHQLFDDYWQWSLRESPSQATFVGDRRYNDRFDDVSAEAVERRRQDRAGFLARLQAIDPDQLDDTDRASREFLGFMLRNAARCDRLIGALPFDGCEFGGLTPVTVMDGPQLFLPELVDATPFDTLKDYDNYLSRLHALTTYLAQLTQSLRAGKAHG
jgi:uncharacterized protein (DUF885 family)